VPGQLPYTQRHLLQFYRPSSFIPETGVPMLAINAEQKYPIRPPCIPLASCLYRVQYSIIHALVSLPWPRRYSNEVQRPSGHLQ
jgi:hypothetical protein